MIELIDDRLACKSRKVVDIPRMLTDLDEMPDEAEIHVFVASRGLTQAEETEVQALHDAWLTLWSAAFRCPASRSRTMFCGQVLYWAVDFRPREARGVTGGLIGTELDLLYRPLEIFEASLQPALKIIPNVALIIDGTVVPMGPEWHQLKAAGRLTGDVQVITNCTVGAWRAGKLLHRLADDPYLAPMLLNPAV